MTMTTISALDEAALPLESDGGWKEDVRLIRRLKISGMLSFGPQGIELELEPLNVLIGPNGSGKSNFMEALALLHAAPHDLSAPVMQMGGISEWLWKGDDGPSKAVIDIVVGDQDSEMLLRHVLEISEDSGRFIVADERIENERQGNGTENGGNSFFYRFNSDIPIIVDENGHRRRIRSGTLSRDESIISQRNDPDNYQVLYWLHEQYRAIRMYRNWVLGPDAGLRQSPRADQPSSFLAERGENLALLLSKLRGDNRQKFIKSLQQLYDGIADFQVEVGGGRADLFVVERGAGTRYIPASRLSDGTLRYMALAAILLDPEPPPLVVIEEPELGLHPNVILSIGEMLIESSKRTQLVVTTHSRLLVDALDDCPSSVVVCDKFDGESVFERLDPVWLKEWLEKYSLGSLWSAGDLGGNPW